MRLILSHISIGCCCVDSIMCGLMRRLSNNMHDLVSHMIPYSFGEWIVDSSMKATVITFFSAAPFFCACRRPNNAFLIYHTTLTMHLYHTIMQP